jgi:hypothetical protein
VQIVFLFVDGSPTVNLNSHNCASPLALKILAWDETVACCESINGTISPEPGVRAL